MVEYKVIRFSDDNAAIGLYVNQLFIQYHDSGMHTFGEAVDICNSLNVEQ